MKGHGSFVLSGLLLLGGAGACSHQSPPAVQQPAIAEAPAAKPPARVVPAEAPPAVVTARDPASIYFDFDSAMLGDDARDVLAKIATNLRNRDASRVAVEGNCDELGTVEYNLALGQQRAEAAKKYLVQMGVDPHLVQTASYGSQRPRYRGHDDGSRAKNRRDDLIYR